MRLAIITLVALCSIARAAPKTADLLAAERAWAIAEQEPDAKKSVALWEAAAVAFDRAVPNAGAHQRSAAEAAVLAWKNAIARDAITRKPTAAATREDALLRSLEIYTPFAPATEIPSLLFARAHSFYKRDRLDEAVPIFEDLVTRFPTDDTAEYAANTLLDALDRQRDFARLSAWVTRMRAMPKLTAKRRDLAETLGRLHVQLLRKQAEAHEADGAFLECAATYREAARSPYDRKDELLYNAGVCFERAGAKTDAIKAFRDAAKLKTSLAGAAKARADRLKP